LATCTGVFDFEQEKGSQKRFFLAGQSNQVSIVAGNDK